MIGFMGTFISPLTISLIAAAVIAQGLGYCVYLAPEATAPITDAFTVVTSVEDVADLLAATQISAQAAADLTAMFGQNPAPARVYIATYDDPETVDDAMDIAVASEEPIGLIAIESRATADIAAICGWLAASQYRLWRYKAHLQTDDADILTSGFPVALASTEIPAVTLHWHSSDAASQGPAAAGLFSAWPLVDRPAGLHVYLRGIPAPTITNAQRVFAKSNNAVVLQILGAGASSQTLIMDQTKQASGDGMSGVYTLSYTLIRALASLESMIDRKASIPELLRADLSGAIEVAGYLVRGVDPLATVGHYVPGEIGGEAAPKGYTVGAVPSGDLIRGSVYCLLGQEAAGVPLSITGEVV